MRKKAIVVTVHLNAKGDQNNESQGEVRSDAYFPDRFEFAAATKGSQKLREDKSGKSTERGKQAKDLAFQLPPTHLVPFPKNAFPPRSEIVRSVWKILDLEYRPQELYARALPVVQRQCSYLPDFA